MSMHRDGFPSEGRSFAISTCNSGKISYARRSCAKARAKQCASRHGMPISVYRCDVCGWWHLTKNIPYRKRAKR